MTRTQTYDVFYAMVKIAWSRGINVRIGTRSQAWREGDLIELKLRSSWALMTLTLSHEIGHVIAAHDAYQTIRQAADLGAFRARGRRPMTDKQFDALLNRTASFFAANWNTNTMSLMPSVARKRVYDQEVEAWDIGQSMLREVGFTDWTLFRSHRDSCLATYRRALQLGEFDPRRL